MWACGGRIDRREDDGMAGREGKEGVNERSHLGICLNGPSTKGNNQNERVGFLHGLDSTLEFVVWPSENAKVKLMTG